MKMRVVLFVLCVATAGAWAAPTVDVTKPPPPETLRELAAMPAQEAGQAVRDALIAAWGPARGSLPGAAMRPAYRQWARLAEWFDLLSESEDATWERFVARYLGLGEKDGKEVLFYRLPGQEFNEGIRPVPRETIQEIAADAGARKNYAAKLLPAGFEFKGGTVGDRLPAPLREAISTDPDFQAEFLGTLSEADFTPAVFQILTDLYSGDPAKFSEYRNLAIALAVVYDQTLPPDWPHHQVAPSAVPVRAPEPVKMFAEWTAANARPGLLFDLRKLGADQLKFVIDAPVEPSEFEWARKNVRLQRTNFERAFSGIKYVMARVKGQQYDWPDGQPYTLEAIQKTGGICVDQAYFAMVAGKAKGLPTLFFVGQGADGGHAWFGYLQGDNRWNLDCGRYENQNYATGTARDPQTWEPITDHELKFLSSRARRMEAFEAGMTDALIAGWLARENRPEDALRTMDSALAASPQNPGLWEQKGMFLAQAGKDAELAPHFEKAAAAFAGNRDLQTRFQVANIEALRTAGKAEEASALEKKLISQNRRGRSDVSVNALAGRMQEMIEAGKTDEAMREFRSEINRLGRTGGGDFFYQVVRPLVEALAEKDKKREAGRVLDMTRRSLNPTKGQILDVEISKLEASVNLQK